jgi:hypothetical protein
MGHPAARHGLFVYPSKTIVRWRRDIFCKGRSGKCGRFLLADMSALIFPDETGLFRAIAQAVTNGMVRRL